MGGAAIHDVFDAISDPTRRQMIGLLAERELSIAELARPFPLSRTAVIKHLAMLQETGLVQEQKIGRERRLRLNAEPLKEVQEWVSFYEKFWQTKLTALDQHLRRKHDET